MTLAVVYDHGAATPTDILRIGMSRPVAVVLAPSAHAQQMRPFFESSCAAVLDLDDNDLLTRLEKHHPAGVLTYSESTIPATSKIASAFGLPYHDADTVELLTSKAAQRRRLRQAGVDQTRSETVSCVDQWDSAVTRVGLPAIVKPVHGVSSRNTVLIRDTEEGRIRLGTLLREEGVVVVEEYLRGVEVPDPFGDFVSVETIVQGGELRHLPITGKFRMAPPFRECGQFWIALLDIATRDSVTELADRATRALNIQTGVLHTEIKLTPDGPRIIEVNGRVGGYVPELAERASSIDLVAIAAKIACGERVTIPEFQLDRVFGQFSTPATIRASIVSAVPRLDVLDDIPGVVDYYSFIRPGATVGGIRSHEIDMVALETADHESLASTINMIMDRIVYEFECEGAPVIRSARDLVYDTSAEFPSWRTT